MAGTFPGVCNTQQNDVNGAPLAACLLTVYVGGTTTLAATFQDIGLTLPTTNPLIADASGRLPLFFVADGTYNLRLTDQYGVQSNGGFYLIGVPSIGASTSGGGGTPVDPTTVFTTGDWKWRPSSEVLSGWVRLNGRTIGNASSGASERANADTQPLFVYIWGTYADTLCPVLGGRGANALADFAAGKQITLLDMRGRAPFGLDDMGNAPKGAFTNATFTTGNATTGGSSLGANSFTITTANLPPYTPAGAISQVTGTVAQQGWAGTTGVQVNTGLSYGSNNGGATNFGLSLSSQTFTGTPQGGTSTPISSVPSAMLGTHYWKL